MKETYGYPVNLLFIKKGNRINISFNGQEIEFKTILKCKEKLNKLIKDEDKKSIDKYNEEVRKENRREYKKFCSKNKKKKPVISGYIYIIKSDVSYKIGKTKNYKSRKKKIHNRKPKQN